MSYQINKNYEVTDGEIISVEKNEDYNCLVLTMKISVFHQGFPACRTPGGYEEQIAYLKEVFEVTDEKDLIGKKLIAVYSSCDVFCVYNPENSQFYSLQAKFFPEKYAESLKQVREEEKIEIYDQLDDFNTLMIGVVKAQKDKNAVKILENVLDKQQLRIKLEDKLPSTYKSKANKI